MTAGSFIYIGKPGHRAGHPDLREMGRQHSAASRRPLDLTAGLAGWGGAPPLRDDGGRLDAAIEGRPSASREATRPASRRQHDAARRGLALIDVRHATGSRIVGLLATLRRSYRTAAACPSSRGHRPTSATIPSTASPGLRGAVDRSSLRTPRGEKNGRAHVDARHVHAMLASRSSASRCSTTQQHPQVASRRGSQGRVCVPVRAVLRAPLSAGASCRSLGVSLRRPAGLDVRGTKCEELIPPI